LIFSVETTLPVPRISTYSHHRSADFFEFFSQVAEVTTFLRSTRRQRFWIKKQHDWAGI